MDGWWIDGWVNAQVDGFMFPRLGVAVSVFCVPFFPGQQSHRFSATSSCLCARSIVLRLQQYVSRLFTSVSSFFFVHGEGMGVVAGGESWRVVGGGLHSHLFFSHFVDEALRRVFALLLVRPTSWPNLLV